MRGARWDDWRTGCHLHKGGAALRPMCQLAWRSGCSAADRTTTSSGGSAADVAAKLSDWRGSRAAASTSLHPVLSCPAPGLPADRGSEPAGAAPSGAERSTVTCKPVKFAKPASVTYP